MKIIDILKQNLKKITYVCIFFVSALPFIANANVDDIDFSNDAGLPTFNEWKWFIKYETPYYFALIVIKKLIEFVWIFAIITMMIWWIMFLTSLWVEEKIKKARSIITYSIVWVLVSVLSYVLVDIVNNISLK